MNLPTSMAPWLDAIATAMLHALWQVPAIALPAAALLVLSARNQAAARSLVASVALILSGVMFLVTTVRALEIPTVTPAMSTSNGADDDDPAIAIAATMTTLERLGITAETVFTRRITDQPVSPVQTAASGFGGSAEPGMTTATSAPTATAAATPRPTAEERRPVFVAAEDARMLVGWAWLLGVLLLQARLAWYWISSQRLRHHGTLPVDSWWLARFDVLRAAAGVSPRVRMVASIHADSPMVLGWLAPVVLVPVAAFTAIPREQLEMVIRHELEHIRRLDPLFNLLTQIASHLLFFHPVAWWLLKVAREEREFACDAIATRTPADARLLAEGLLRLEAMRMIRPTLSLSSQGGPLMRRVSRLFATTRTGPAPCRRTIGPALVAMAAISTVIPFAAAEPADVPIAPPIEETDDMTLVRRSIQSLRELADRGIISRDEAATGIAAVADSFYERIVRPEREDFERRLEAGESPAGFPRLETQRIGWELDLLKGEALEDAEIERLDDEETETRQRLGIGAISRVTARQTLHEIELARLELGLGQLNLNLLRKWVEFDRAMQAELPEGVLDLAYGLGDTNQADTTSIALDIFEGVLDLTDALGDSGQGTVDPEVRAAIGRLEQFQNELEYWMAAEQLRNEASRLRAEAEYTRLLADEGELSADEADQTLLRIVSDRRMTYSQLLQVMFLPLADPLELRERELRDEMNAISTDGIIRADDPAQAELLERQARLRRWKTLMWVDGPRVFWSEVDRIVREEEGPTGAISPEATERHLERLVLERGGIFDEAAVQRVRDAMPWLELNRRAEAGELAEADAERMAGEFWRRLAGSMVSMMFQAEEQWPRSIDSLIESWNAER